MIDIRETGSVVIIDVQEDLGIDTIDTFREVIESAQDKTTQIILNLEGAGYMNSQAIGLISSVKRRLSRQDGGDLKIANPTARVRELLEVTRLDKIIQIFDVVDQAVEAFHGK